MFAEGRGEAVLLFGWAGTATTLPAVGVGLSWNLWPGRPLLWPLFPRGTGRLGRRGCGTTRDRVTGAAVGHLSRQRDAQRVAAGGRKTAVGPAAWSVQAKDAFPKPEREAALAVPLALVAENGGWGEAGCPAPEERSR